MPGFDLHDQYGRPRRDTGFGRDFGFGTVPHEHEQDRENRTRPGDPRNDPRAASRTAAKRAAGRDTKDSPAEQLRRQHRNAAVFTVAVLTLDGYIVWWLAGHDAPGWLVWTFGTLTATSVLLNLWWRPKLHKLRMRREALAREQVHQVRQLATTDMTTLGLGDLFDAWPGAAPPLHRPSVEAGARFALDRAVAEMDTVDESMPKARLFGKDLSDAGPGTGFGPGAPGRA